MFATAGSAEHAKGIEWFFKESYGSYTRNIANGGPQMRREILKRHGSDFQSGWLTNFLPVRSLKRRISQFSCLSR
jgi:hypothetical protein